MFWCFGVPLHVGFWTLEAISGGKLASMFSGVTNWWFLYFAVLLCRRFLHAAVGLLGCGVIRCLLGVDLFGGLSLYLVFLAFGCWFCFWLARVGSLGVFECFYFGIVDVLCGVYRYSAPVFLKSVWALFNNYRKKKKTSSHLISDTTC